jgi:DNA-directed RNA polymerase specialized sigma subunit
MAATRSRTRLTKQEIEDGGKRWQRNMNRMVNTRRTHQPIENVAARTKQPDPLFYSDETLAKLYLFKQTLHTRDQVIFALRIETVYPKTQCEVANILGITQGAVSGAESDIKRRLQRFWLA